jgi:predicted nucleic acid-binding protein
MVPKNYVEKEQVIKEFCMKLFKKPSFSELEKTDFDIQMSIVDIQMSIVSEEVPLLSFSSND